MEENRKCMVCGKERIAKKISYQYGISSCKIHITGLANLRGLAFIIDIIFLSFITVVIGEIILGMQTQIFSQKYGYIITMCFFLIRDSFWGRSPGKFICGLVTIDATTKAPITPLASFKRNLPLLIPFMPLVVAFQLKGTRIGDGWSNARVIRIKHRKIFTTGEVKLTD